MDIDNYIINDLDPPDWARFENQLNLVVEDVVHHLQHIRDKPVWTRPGQKVREALRSPVPLQGIGLDEAYHEFRENILPHITGNIHPKFLGWVVGSGAPTSMVGDWLAAFANGAPTLFDDSCLLTELQVLNWLKDLLGLDNEASGILTSGASEATLISLTAARYAALGDEIKRRGLYSLQQEPIFYISDQTHDCARKSIEILGFGSNHIRTICTDNSYRMKCAALDSAIKSDIEKGKKPIAVVATLATVNTGSFDDVKTIAEICKSHGVWLHIDAAFGAWASLSNEFRHLLEQFRLGDSIAVDLHKWMFQCYDLGCAFVRNPLVHKRSLGTAADYIAPIKGSLTDSPDRLSARAIQLSRGFKALKLWFSVKSEGIAGFASAIERNLELARYLAEAVKKHDRLQLLAPVPLHIINCRYVGGLQDQSALNEINRRILTRFHETGFAIPSSTMLDGNFSIRICISNHRTRRRDLDAVISEMVSLGRSLEADMCK